MPVQLGAVEVPFDAPGLDEFLRQVRVADTAAENLAAEGDEAARALRQVGRGVQMDRATAGLRAADAAMEGLRAESVRTNQSLDGVQAELFQVGLAARSSAQIFSAGFQRMEDAIERLGTRARQATRETSALSGVFQGVSAGILAQRILAVGQALFTAGTAAEETASKFRTTFLDATEEVDGFIASYARMAGLSKTEAREITATLGAMTRGLGASVAESARLSQAVLRLAGDLTSFNNVPIEEALVSLRAGLIGEYEPMRRFGVVLTDATVVAKALAMTSKESADELTALDKVMARVTLTTEQMQVQIGDLERTKGSLANRARAVQADFKNLREEVGSNLSFAFSGLVSVIGAVGGALGAGSTLVTGIVAATGVMGTLAAAALGVRSVMNILAVQTLPQLGAALSTFMLHPAVLALVGIGATVGLIAASIAKGNKALAEQQARTLELAGDYAALTPLAEQMNAKQREITAEQTKLDTLRRNMDIGATTRDTERLAAQEARVQSLTAEWNRLNEQYVAAAENIRTAREAEASTAATEANVKALAERVDVLTKLRALNMATAQDTANLLVVERQLQAAVDSGALSDSQRAEAGAALAKVRESLTGKTEKLTAAERKLADQRAALDADPSRGGDSPFYENQNVQAAANAGLSTAMQGIGGEAPAFDWRSTVDAATNAMIAALRGVPQRIAPVLTELQTQLAQTFTTGFQNLGLAIVDGLVTGLLTGDTSDMGRTILAGLGSIFQQMGAAMIASSGIFSALGAAMSNPFTAGPALAAFGAALVALGATLGGIARGRGGARGGVGGSYAGGGSTDETIRVTLNRPEGAGIPRIGETVAVPSTGADIVRDVQPMPPVVNNVTVIGPNDPIAQREILKLVRNGESRGY